MKHYDILIIGAGTAGLSAAKEAARHTNNFAIIESGPVGTLCARTGCMPSKALIAAARKYHERKDFITYGIHGAQNISVNIPEVFEHVRKLRDRFVESVKEGMKNYEVIQGKAFLKEPNIVEVNGSLYKANAIILCTGSLPRIPDVFKPYRNDILTTEELFERKGISGSLAIIGSGSIGVEIGQALARLGIKITLFGRSKKIAGISDPDINLEVQKILEKELDVRLNSSIESVEKNEQGFCVYSSKGHLNVENIFVSAGRIPNIKGLGLEDLGIKMNKKGVPLFDRETLKIKNYDIYLAGDVNAERAVQHEAADEGKIAVQNALGIGELTPRRVPFAITFTDPPVVQLGNSYEGLKSKNPIIGEISYKNQGRAVIEGKNQGKVKLYCTKDGVLVGAEMIAPSADHFGHLLALAVQEKISLKSLLKMPFYHPVLEEGIRTALRNMYRKIYNCN